MAAASAIFDALLEDPEVRALLADPERGLAMVEVEVALARVQAELGVIPAEALAPIAAAPDGQRPALAHPAAGTLAGSFDEVGCDQATEPVVRATSYVRDDLRRFRLIRRRPGTWPRPTEGAPDADPPKGP